MSFVAFSPSMGLNAAANSLHGCHIVQPSNGQKPICTARLLTIFRNRDLTRLHELHGLSANEQRSQRNASATIARAGLRTKHRPSSNVTSVLAILNL